MITESEALKAVLQREPLPFKQLAQAWLQAGATSFSVWCNGKRLAVWPPNTALNPTGLIIPIQREGRNYGELRLTGVMEEEARLRLEAEAGLITAWLQKAVELKAVVAELSESQDQQLALYDLSQSMRSQLDLVQSVHALTRQAMRMVKAQAAFIYLDIPGASPLLGAYPASFLNEITAAMLLEQMRQHGQPRLLHAALLLAPSSVLAGPVTGYLYVIPLQIRGSTMAVLGVMFEGMADSLSPSQKLSQAIARQAEAHLESILLHQDTLQQARLQTEVELARDLQFRLLPQKLVAPSGLDVYVSMRPAKMVSGDFYDFITEADRFITIFGDVAGKGMPAALVMAMTHIILQSAARFMPNFTPKAILQRANQDLYDYFTEAGLFATAFIAQYHPAERRLTYANNGHSPIFYFPAGGSGCLLEADAPPLGVLPFCLSENHILSIAPGDILVLATDGFSEACNPAQELFGYARLQQVIERHISLTAREIGAALYAAVEDFSNNSLRDDDQTLMVIKGVTDS